MSRLAFARHWRPTPRISPSTTTGRWNDYASASRFAPKASPLNWEVRLIPCILILPGSLASAAGRLEAQHGRGNLFNWIVWAKMAFDCCASKHRRRAPLDGGVHGFASRAAAIAWKRALKLGTWDWKQGCGCVPG